ncbi:hypothetical protein Dsin_018909 [Dipteronia sinensis]|uniref:Uncharacterized protein n=1 Tax=Dipteronia sinensis TaxID=43782 RepID=A0AAE0A7N5_9ROSI|nr:hypothetical protein Dsin_018909 [Dipteronia sinensis]
MRYVKPCRLFYEMLKSAMELANKKAIGPQLLNILEKHVTISISEPRLLLAIHYGVVERKMRNIHTIANLFQTLIPKYNLGGAVIGCPDVESIDNHEVAKVKSFVEDLSNTGKLEELGVIHCHSDIWQGYLDHCGMKVKPGPFDQSWYSESQKALYLQKLNQVKVDKLTNLDLVRNGGSQWRTSSIVPSRPLTSPAVKPPHTAQPGYLLPSSSIPAGHL